MERSKSLFERDLLPRQTFDDTDARYQAAQAQLELAMAQFSSEIAARRAEDQSRQYRDHVAGGAASSASARSIPAPGVGVNTSFISVVDIRTVRLVINVIEKDLRRIHAGHCRSKSKSTRIPARSSMAGSRGSRRFSIRHAHRAGGNRDPQLRVPSEAGDTRARDSPSRSTTGAWSYRPSRSSICRARSACGCRPTRAIRPFSTRSRSASSSRTSPRSTSGLKEGQRITTGAAALRPGDRIVMAGQRRRQRRQSRRRHGAAASAADLVNANQGAAAAAGHSSYGRVGQTPVDSRQLERQ